MKTALAWCLWLWMILVIVGAFFYAPPAEGFLGESSRILFFHVPMAWVSFIAFMHAGVASIRYLNQRRERFDQSAAAAVEIGLVYCLLATVTGSMWAKTMWGAFWNWDPRQITIVATLLFYAAYLALRGAVEDRQARATLTAAYAVLGLAITPFLLFVAPRIIGFTLHPDPVINDRGTIDMESRMYQVLLASSLGFTALYFWLHDLRRRTYALVDREENRERIELELGEARGTR